MPGLFITFEGPDGCGKSTQARLVYDQLVRRGQPAVHTREPGGTRLGEAIRQLLLDPANEEMAERTEILLYAASRAQHVDEVIRPALEAGKTVVCDRFVDSSLVYQGFGLGRDVNGVRMVNEVATGGLRPTVTILLDVDPEVGLARVGRRSTDKDGSLAGADRIEQRLSDYHARVREGYLTLAREEPGRIKTVRTDDRSLDQVAADVRRILADYLPEVFGEDRPE